jgi:hypothetical protein
VLPRLSRSARACSRSPRDSSTAAAARARRSATSCTGATGVNLPVWLREEAESQEGQRPEKWPTRRGVAPKSGMLTLHTPDPHGRRCPVRRHHLPPARCG